MFILCNLCKDTYFNLRETSFLQYQTKIYSFFFTLYKQHLKKKLTNSRLQHSYI